MSMEGRDDGCKARYHRNIWIGQGGMGGASHILFSDGCRGVLSLQTWIIMLAGLGVAWHGILAHLMILHCSGRGL